MFEIFLRTLNKFSNGLLKSDVQHLLLALEKDGYSKIKIPLSFQGDQTTSKVLVIIPFKDRADLTTECVTGLFSQKLKPHQSIELLLIDHQSKDLETSHFVHSMLSWKNLGSVDKISCLQYVGEFNFSKMMNLGVTAAQASKPDLLLFLNNDVEFSNSLTVGRMMDILEYSANVESSNRVGVVGLDLLYPDRTIQHVCAWPGSKIVATHPLKGTLVQSLDLWRGQPYRCVPAVTGAALMCRVKDFEQWGKFDEELPVLAQDIDLCLKAREHGQNVVVLTDSNTIHKEGRTIRSQGFCFEQLKHFYARWTDKSVFEKTSRGALSSWSERPTPRLSFEPAYPWRWFASKPQ